MDAASRRRGETGILRALEEGVLRVRSGRVIEANIAMRSMLERGDVLGTAISELFADVAGRPLAALRTLETARLRTPGGQLKPVSVRRATDEVFIIVDRSRERRLEEEVWALGGVRPGTPDPLAPLAGEVAALLEHELHTVYTAVRGQLRLLAEKAGALDPEQRECLHGALRAAERGDALACNLVALLRGECSELASVRKPLGLHDVLRRAALQCRPLLEAAGVSAELDLGAEDDQVLGDADWLEQVFVNLLSNAARFAPRGSAIQIHTSLVQLGERESLCAAVRDAGPGVPAADAERIFAPFVRGDSSGGIGLGLAICRRAVGAHGGTIEAVPGNGGLFRVLLPHSTEKPACAPGARGGA
jgi:signal transduction histidine kinase